MEKRLFLTIALSLLVLVTWSSLVSRTQHVENDEVTTISQPNLPAVPEPQKQIPLQLVEEISPDKLFSYVRERFEIVFIEPQAAVKEVIFRGKRDYTFTLKNGFWLQDASLVFEKSKTTSEAVAFTHRDPNKTITKSFIFPNNSNEIWLELKINNISSSPLVMNVPMVLGTLELSGAQARFFDATVAGAEKTQHVNLRKNQDFSETNFLGIRDRYFCVLIQEETGKPGAFIRKISNLESEAGLVFKDITLAAGQQVTKKFHIYLGPQDLKLISGINSSWAGLINYGTFDFISQLLLQLLEFFYRLVHNWGWAIVLLSLAIYFGLYPLSVKQMRSMKEMQALQPKIEELRKVYKDNPQKLNKEIMELYRTHKVNPFGGCLPLLFQMPIFFALYQVLLRSEALRGANFLWIKDLSEPDKLFTLPMSLPVLGSEINILPILMTIGMFAQQKISSAKVATGSSAEQQKMMMIIMPLMFGFIFYHMPSGLVLYWFVNSGLMLFYQIRMNRAK